MKHSTISFSHNKVTNPSAENWCFFHQLIIIITMISDVCLWCCNFVAPSIFRRNFHLYQREQKEKLSHMSLVVRRLPWSYFWWIGRLKVHPGWMLNYLVSNFMQNKIEKATISSLCSQNLPAFPAIAFIWKSGRTYFESQRLGWFERLASFSRNKKQRILFFCNNFNAKIYKRCSFNQD